MRMHSATKLPQSYRGGRIETTVGVMRVPERIIQWQSSRWWYRTKLPESKILLHTLTVNFACNVRRTFTSAQRWVAVSYLQKPREMHLPYRTWVHRCKAVTSFSVIFKNNNFTHTVVANSA